MSTLAAYARFLTARWDEIEARELSPDDLSGSGHAYGCWPHDKGEPFLCHCRLPYLRDDLAAKRAVVERARRVAIRAAYFGTLIDREALAVVSGVVADLAEPFRDHPDHPANGEG